MEENKTNSKEIIQEFLETRTAALFLGISESTMKKMRANGDGPIFVRMGQKCVRYHVSDLRNWANQNKHRVIKGYDIY